MMSPGKAVDDLIARTIHPSLLTLGFERLGRANCWNRKAGALIHIIEIHRPRFQGEAKKDFRIEWAVGVPGAMHQVWARDDPDRWRRIDGIVGGSAPALLGHEATDLWCVDEESLPNLPHVRVT
jgi:hypothetical protein